MQTIDTPTIQLFRENIDHCPFCLSMRTSIKPTKSKKEQTSCFFCIYCNARLFLPSNKIENINNTFLIISENYEAENYKELLESEQPEKNIGLHCPICQETIEIKRCKMAQKKVPMYYIKCTKLCGCRGFLNQDSLNFWYKTSSLLSFI